MVTHKFKHDDISKALEFAATGEGIKVVIDYELQVNKTLVNFANVFVYLDIAQILSVFIEVQVRKNW